MNKKNMSIAAILILAFASFWILNSNLKKSEQNKNVEFKKAVEKGYWTCPMHPQIHQDHPGECPICHMNLVHVNEAGSETAEVSEDTVKNKVTVSASDRQMELMGVQKHKVEKMSLKALIPISGRFLSASSVAFQVYEQDIKYVHAGLGFTGESSVYNDVPLTGVVSSVDSIVDPVSRTIRVVGSVQKGPRGLVAESSFRGEIEILIQDKIMIPESSVLHSGSQNLVYIFVDDKKLQGKVVQLGLKTEGYYEVLSGLEVGQMISSGPNFLIDSEAKMRSAQ